MIWGWSMRKAGLRQRLSRYSPTSLSSSRAVLCGGGHSTRFASHCTKPYVLGSNKLPCFDTTAANHLSHLVLEGRPC